MNKFIFRVAKAESDNLWYWSIKKNKAIVMDDGIERKSIIFLESGQNADPRVAVAEMRAAYDKYR